MIEEISKLFEDQLSNVHHNNKVNDVKDLEVEVMVSATLSCLRVGMMRKSDLQAIAIDIGTRLRNMAKLPRKSDDACHTGLFFIRSLHEAGIVKIFGYQPKNKKFMKYIVSHTIRKWDLKKAFETYKPINDGYEVMIEPADDWESGVHPTGRRIVRRSGGNNVLKELSPEKQEAIFSVINRKQRIGWNINQRLLDVQSYILENGAPEGMYPFDFMDPQMKEEARDTKHEEVVNILEYAYGIGEHTFYHLYNMDFRGRIYPNSQLIHEQTCDEAKSLLLFADGTPLRNGYWYLVDNVANNWGHDKETLKKKRELATEVMDEWLAYAADPIGQTGWMEADKPWSFLAGCMELYNLAEWVEEGNNEADFITRLPVYIDGANNGLQHIAAATRDTTVGSLVNIVPQGTFGDAYMHMADAAYEVIRKQYDPELDALFQEIREEFFEWGERIEAAETPEERYALIDKLKGIRAKRKNDIIAVAPNYWMQQKVYDKRRKTVKRNVMTLAYGGTEFGFMKQIVEDTSLWGKEWKHMEYTWAGYLGSLIYNLARGNKGYEAILPGCAKALTMCETLAGRASEKGDNLKWTVPGTDFVVLHDYKKATDKRIKTEWDGCVHKLVIKMWEQSELNKEAQKTAASPNIIHSLDAAHLTLTCHNADFDVVTIHDSFGCMAGDMAALHKIVREEFVKLYKDDPLDEILKQHESIDLKPESGSLDIDKVTEAEFCFI